MTKIIKLSASASLILNVNYDNGVVILIIPGGGYNRISYKEGFPVAVKFNGYGYDTAILMYSTVPFAPAKPLSEGILALKELSKSYKNIIAMGFSAGGHLAGLLGTEKNKYNLKGMILGYPVITLGNQTHEETAKNFVGVMDNPPFRREYSVHCRVTNETVPCFIWATQNDEVVPIHNSNIMIEALKQHNVFFQTDMYCDGPHGLALADETTIIGGDHSFVRPEIQGWPDKANEFIKKIIK